MNKKKFQLYILNFIIFIISYMSMYINNLLFNWMLMEIMTMTFITTLIISNNKLPSINYFLMSFLSSSCIFISIIIFLNSNMISCLFLIGLMMKLAMFPFNKWFNLMSMSITYMNLFNLMTYMKFIPFILCNLFPMNNIIIIMIMMNLIIMPMMMMNKNSIKLILSYSSIHQTSIMLIILILNFEMFLWYFTMYSTTNFMITIMFDYMNNLNNSNYLMINQSNKLFVFMNLLMYSYFPPMTTFIMKWSILEHLMINNNMNFMNILLSLLIMMSSIFTTWNYINMMNNNLYQMNYIKMFMNNLYKKKLMYYLYISMMIFMPIMYSILNF